jgi:hypothetical protein
MLSARILPFLFLMLPPNPGPVGAIATVEKLDRQANTAVIRVLNTSQKNIAAFSVSVDAVYADGWKAHSEKMLDYGPRVVTRNGALHPTETSEQSAAWTVIPGNPLQKVEVHVVTVTYEDGTADVSDEQAYQRIVDHRTQFATALQKSAEILANALANASTEHPGAAAASDMKALLQQEASSSSGHIDKTYLQVLIPELQGAQQKASELGITEREYLNRRLTTLQQDAHLHASYSQIRRAQ